MLKGDKPLKKRPGELLKPYDFDAARKATGARKLSEEDLVAQAMFPGVFRDYARFVERCGDVSVIDTPIFFYGLKPGEEAVVTIEEGKTLIVKLLAVGELEPDGTRQVFFELNGRRRDVVIRTAPPPAVASSASAPTPTTPTTSPHRWPARWRPCT